MTGCISPPVVMPEQAMNVEALNKVADRGAEGFDLTRGRNVFMTSGVMAELLGMQSESPEVMMSKRGMALQRIGRMPTFQEFMTIMKDGTKAEIRDYLDAGMDQLINGDLDHRSPLLLAVARNEPDTVETLLNISHTDVNKCDIQGWTPLHEACCIGTPRIVKLLVDRPEITINCLYNDVFLNRINNWTPLHEACSGGHVEAVSLLISHPTCNVNSAYSDNSPVKKFLTPLLVALLREEDEVVQCLLRHPNIDVEYANEVGNTVLHEACAAGNANVVQMLLAMPGIVVRPINDDRQTPYDIAVANGQYHIAGMLAVMGNPSTSPPVTETNDFHFGVLQHFFATEVGVTG